MTLKIDNDTCWIMTFNINGCTLHSAVSTMATTTNTHTSSGTVSAKLSLQKYAFRGGITWTSWSWYPHKTTCQKHKSANNYNGEQKLNLKYQPGNQQPRKQDTDTLTSQHLYCNHNHQPRPHQYQRFGQLLLLMPFTHHTMSLQHIAWDWQQVWLDCVTPSILTVSTSPSLSVWSHIMLIRLLISTSLCNIPVCPCAVWPTYAAKSGAHTGVSLPRLPTQNKSSSYVTLSCYFWDFIEA